MKRTPQIARAPQSEQGLPLVGVSDRSDRFCVGIANAVLHGLPYASMTTWECKLQRSSSSSIAIIEFLLINKECSGSI